MSSPAPTIRFHAGETIFAYHSNRTARVLADTPEHVPVNLRWLDTGEDDRRLPESVESASQHTEWLREQKAGTRR